MASKRTTKPRFNRELEHTSDTGIMDVFPTSSDDHAEEEKESSPFGNAYKGNTINGLTSLERKSSFALKNGTHASATASANTSPKPKVCQMSNKFL